MLQIKKQPAFSLVEAVIALGITVMVMMASISASRVSQQNARITVAANEVQQLVDDGVNMAVAYKQAGGDFGLVDGESAYYVFYPQKGTPEPKNCAQKTDPGSSGKCYYQDGNSDGGGALMIGACKVSPASIPVDSCLSKNTPFIFPGNGLRTIKSMSDFVKSDGNFNRYGEMLNLRNFASADQSQYFVVSTLNSLTSNVTNGNAGGFSAKMAGKASLIGRQIDSNFSSEDFSTYYRSIKVTQVDVTNYTVEVMVQNRDDKKITQTSSVSI